MSFYRRHVFVCSQVRPEGHPKGCCAHRLPGDVTTALWEGITQAGITDIRINTAGCLGQCDKGPVMVIYPEGVWYTFSTEEDVQEILDSHLVRGETVGRLKLA